jgi:hypothetical protein
MRISHAQMPVRPQCCWDFREGISRAGSVLPAVLTLLVRGAIISFIEFGIHAVTGGQLHTFGHSKLKKPNLPLQYLWACGLCVTQAGRWLISASTQGEAALHRLNVGSLLVFGALRHFERDFLAFLEGLETAHLDAYYYSCVYRRR